MKEKINIVYVDDNHDTILGKYLDKEYHNCDYEIEYEEVLFDASTGYESLLQDIRVTHSNIVIIDSRLFENSTISNSKFTGEEFKLVLKKLYPFIEVIVITQNESNRQLGIISKYKHNPEKDGSQYYAETMPQYIDNAIRNISMFRKLASKMEENRSWEPVLKEKIISSLQGSSAYDELTKKDIDNLISAFKEIEVKLDAQ